MAERIRNADWNESPLGPIEFWSETLVATVNVMLAAPNTFSIYWGPQGTLLYNDHYRELLHEKHPSALGRPGSEVWSEAWEIIGPQIKAAFDLEETTNVREAMIPILVGGQLRAGWYTYGFHPLYENGKVIGVANPGRDETELVKSKLSLKSSEEQARRVLQSIGDAVIVTDAEDAVKQMNPVAEKLTGWSFEQAKGQPLGTVLRLVGEESRQPVESPLHKVQRKEEVVDLANHTILIARDGKETHIDDSAAPIRDEAGDLTGVVLVFRDIEERRTLEKQKEKAFLDLHATLTKLQLAMEFAEQGSFFYDESTGLITVDAVVQELFEMEGTSGPIDYWVSKVHPEDKQRVLESFAAATAGRAIYDLEHRIVRSDGVRWLDATAKLLSEPGQPVLLTGVCEDITLRKQSETSLLQTEKLAAVGRLASTIAHEINNPLEAVTNLLYLARHSENLAEALPFLETADSELRRASTITTHALRFHKQATRPTSCTFAQLTEGIFTVRQARLGNAGATEHVRDRTTRAVLCFEGEVRQVLSNLIGNAIDALQSAGGALFVRARDGHDWKSGRTGMVVTVADSGTGMSKATLTRLFHAFFTTKGVGGTGLGLWVSKEMVERHEGVMHLRSSQNPSYHGTVFTVFLPYDAALREQKND